MLENENEEVPAGGQQQINPVNLFLFRGQIEMSEDFDTLLPDSFWLGEDEIP